MREGGVLHWEKQSPTLPKDDVTVRKTQPRHDYADPSVESARVVVWGCAVWRVSGWGDALLRGCGAVGLCDCVAVPLCCTVAQGGSGAASLQRPRRCEPASTRAAVWPQGARVTS